MLPEHEEDTFERQEAAAIEQKSKSNLKSKELKVR